MDSDEIDDHVVAQFIEATSASPQHATFFLSACGNNYDRAVQMFHEQMGPGAVIPPSPRRRSANIPPRPRAPGDNALYQPNARGPLSYPLQFVQLVVSLPFVVLNTSVRLISRTLGFGFSIIGAVGQRVLPPSVTNSIRSATRALTAPPPAEDPAAAAAAFIQMFSARYGDHCPRWQSCSWQEASTRAQAQGKFLFVYLHSERHQEADAFCENTLCAPSFIEYVNATFVAWGGDVRSVDAFRLSTSLRAASYPYCGLLAFSGSRIRLVTCVEGCIAAQPLTEVLLSAFVEHGSMLWQEREAQEQRARDRSIREEQDAEYQRSLEEDRERERQAAEVRAAAEEIETQRRAAEEARKAEAVAALERRRSAKRLSLPEEPSADCADGPTALIRIRLPNGATHQRRFMAADPLQLLQDWVDVLDSHDHLKYSLATLYPKRVLTLDENMNKSLEELDLTPQAVVVVQPEVDSEDAAR